MKHATTQEWRLYAAGALSLPRTEELEEHLYACEECLASYMSEIDNIHSARYMTLGEKDTEFADHVMAAIHETIREGEHFVDANRQKAHQKNSKELIAVSHDADSPPMVVITQPKPNSAYRSAMAIIRKPIFQYVAAAAITILLVAAGIFQDIGAYASRVEPAHLSHVNPTTTESFSQQLMEKTTSLLDTIHPIRIGGNSHN